VTLLNFSTARISREAAKNAKETIFDFAASRLRVRQNRELLNFALLNHPLAPSQRPPGRSTQSRSTFSPVPTKRTGTPSSLLDAEDWPRPCWCRPAWSGSMPVTPALSWKALACAMAFCPVEASSTSSVFVRGAVHLLARHRVCTFSSSFIRLYFVCKRPAVSTSSRVRLAALLAGADRVEDHRARVGARLVGDHLDVGALAPHFQLVDSGRAEGVGRAQHAPCSPRLLDSRPPSCRCWSSCPTR
jgi:hypothetical protein